MKNETPEQAWERIQWSRCRVLCNFRHNEFEVGPTTTSYNTSERYKRLIGGSGEVAHSGVDSDVFGLPLHICMRLATMYPASHMSL